MGGQIKIVELSSIFGILSSRNYIFKSVDAPDASKIASLLYKLFREVVLYVGAENVVHIVTYNASNYVAAGKKLEEEFITLLGLLVLHIA